MNQCSELEIEEWIHQEYVMTVKPWRKNLIRMCKANPT